MNGNHPWDDVQVHLTGLRTAGEVCPDLDRRTYLHAGPPLDPVAVPDSMRDALVGTLMLEGEAATPGEAERIISRGDLTLVPCNAVRAVGAVAGVCSRPVHLPPGASAKTRSCSPSSRTSASASPAMTSTHDGHLHVCLAVGEE